MDKKEMATKLSLAINSLTSVLSTTGILGSALQHIADVHNELIKPDEKHASSTEPSRMVPESLDMATN